MPHICHYVLNEKKNPQFPIFLVPPGLFWSWVVPVTNRSYEWTLIHPTIQLPQPVGLKKGGGRQQWH